MGNPSHVVPESLAQECFHAQCACESSVASHGCEKKKPFCCLLCVRTGTLGANPTLNKGSDYSAAYTQRGQHSHGERAGGG
jgi:hypothetical protein